MTPFSMVPVALFAQVGFGEPTNHGVHAFFRSPSRQNPRPATRLGKIDSETVYHGDHALMGSPSCQNWRAVWEKSKWNPLMMAIPQ